MNKTVKFLTDRAKKKTIKVGFANTLGKMKYSNKEANKIIESIIAIKNKKQNIRQKCDLELAFLDKEATDFYMELQGIQGKCKHHFPNKPNPVMGKGICDICGYDDY